MKKNNKKIRRWKIIQKGKSKNDGIYHIGTLINITKCKTDKIFIKRDKKWVEWNKIISIELNNKKMKCFFIPFGYEYKIIGLRDENFEY